MNSRPWLFANICWDINLQMLRSLSRLPVREQLLLGASELAHGIRWLWVEDDPALSHHVGVCMWLITATSRGCQALLRVWATCNLLGLITPLTSKIFTVLLAFGNLDTQCCLGLCFVKPNTLNALRTSPTVMLKVYVSVGNWSKLFFQIQGADVNSGVKYDHLSPTAGPVNGS